MESTGMLVASEPSLHMSSSLLGCPHWGKQPTCEEVQTKRCMRRPGKEQSRQPPPSNVYSTQPLVLWFECLSSLKFMLKFNPHCELVRKGYWVSLEVGTLEVIRIEYGHQSSPPRRTRGLSKNQDTSANIYTPMLPVWHAMPATTLGLGQQDGRHQGQHHTAWTCSLQSCELNKPPILVT
jgi:hypothetical protein